jgi:hypothetical protein
MYGEMQTRMQKHLRTGMQPSNATKTAPLAELVKIASRIVEKNNEFVQLHKTRFNIPGPVLEALNTIGLEYSEMMIMMRALSNTVEQQIFMLRGLDEQLLFIEEKNPGFLRRYVEKRPPNQYFYPGFNGAPPPN